jgi:hypothetical protein
VTSFEEARMTEPGTTDVADLDPVEVVETDQPPTGEPPPDWDPGVHAGEPAPDVPDEEG